MCCFHMGIAGGGGGGGGCKGLLGCFGALFSHVCWFDRGRGVLSYLGNAHIEPTHFKKGVPLLQAVTKLPILLAKCEMPLFCCQAVLSTNFLTTTINRHILYQYTNIQYTNTKIILILSHLSTYMYVFLW